MCKLQHFYQVLNVIHYGIEFNVHTGRLVSHVVEEHLAQVPAHPYRIIILEEVPQLIQELLIEFVLLNLLVSHALNL